MKNFMTTRKNELKFVYNFHCAGKQFVIPYSGKMPNNLRKERPEIKKIFDEIVSQVQFPEGTDIGPVSDIL